MGRAPERGGGGLNTHDELVLKAGWWLRERARCYPVLLEPGYGGVAERPDAIGWRRSSSTVIECKASRRDFLADGWKAHREGGRGMGVRRYYMAPRGVVFPEDLASPSWPEGWGYLELRGRPEKGIAAARVYVMRELEDRELGTPDLRRELQLLAGAMANVQYRARGFEDVTGKHRDHNLGPSPHDEFVRGRTEGWEAAERHAARWDVG